jgi:hypothetical protein
MTSSNSDTPQSVVFVDANVPDLQDLLDGLAPGVEAFVIDPASDGLQQIAALLAANDLSDLSSISIVGHGAAGEIEVGSTMLDADDLASESAALAQIGSALAPGGQIQLYGCDVAQSATGIAFLQQLSDATGGASVATASHPVGAASGGGSWTLDIDVGTVDVAAPFTATALAAYQGELASPSGDLWIGSWHSLIADDLNQIDAVSVSGTTALGKTDVANGLDSGDSALDHPTSLAIDPARDELFVVNAGFTIYAAPAKTGGALAQIYAAPDTNPHEATGYIGDILADEASDSLYFTQSDYNLDTGAQIPSDTGVFSISETGGTATQLVNDIIGGETLYNPTSLGLDLSNNLAFFIENDAYAGGTGAVELMSGSLTFHNYVDQLQIGDFATGFEINTGLVVDPVNQEIYYSIENFYTASENGIYAVHYTVTGSHLTQATLGPVTTLYSGAAAEAPESIAIDPANGLLYVSGEVPLGTGLTGAAWVGSLSGSAVAPLTQIFQLSTDTSNTTGAFADTTIFEAAPSLSAGGMVTFSPGDAPVILDPAVTISDESESDLASATVSVGSGFFSGDTLNYTDQNGISGAYNGSTGTLTLSGIASVADYQAALQSVTYDFSGNPAGTNTTLRTIGWTVSDGVVSSATASTTVNVDLGPQVMGGFNVSGTEGSSTGTVTVATFTDAAITNPTTGDFSGTINWGDGDTTPFTSANISENDGVFSVTGAHTYAGEGSYAIGIAVTDTNNVTGNASDSATVGAAPLGPITGSSADLIMRDGNNGDYEIFALGGNSILAAGPLGQVGLEWQVSGVGGFDGTDTSDMILRKTSTGQFEIYDIGNNVITNATGMGQVGLEWNVAGFGDFSTNAGQTDMLMRNSNTGAFEVYDIANNAITFDSGMGQVGLEWNVAGFGDFSTRANETDMLMRNSNTGAFEVYDIVNNAITSYAPMGQVGLEWTIAGFGDFSSNANETDMLMRNNNTGVFELFDIQNDQITAAAPMGQVGLEWQVAGFGPLNGAGASDMLMRDTNTGAFEIFDISNNQLTGAAPMGQVGMEWSVAGIAADPPPGSGAPSAQLVQAMASADTSAAVSTGNSPGIGAGLSAPTLLAMPEPG